MREVHFLHLSAHAEKYRARLHFPSIEPQTVKASPTRRGHSGVTTDNRMADVNVNVEALQCKEEHSDMGIDESGGGSRVASR